MAAEARRPIPTALSSLLLIAVSLTSPAAATELAPPTPAPWPPQFHAVLFRNHSGSLALIDLWYDWPNGRNFNIIQNQLGAGLRYDLEWNNGTSFYYTLAASGGTCRTVHFDVGILRPDWLGGAQHLGRRWVDGFLCNVWQKADFIWYYEDAATRRPVRWVFYTGRSVDVMSFEVGAAMEDAKWQAPAYCFEKGEEKREPETQAELAGDAPGMRRGCCFCRGRSLSGRGFLAS